MAFQESSRSGGGVTAGEYSVGVGGGGCYFFAVNRYVNAPSRSPALLLVALETGILGADGAHAPELRVRVVGAGCDATARLEGRERRFLERGERARREAVRPARNAVAGKSPC